MAVLDRKQVGMPKYSKKSPKIALKPKKPQNVISKILNLGSIYHKTHFKITLLFLKAPHKKFSNTVKSQPC